MHRWGIAGVGLLCLAGIFVVVYGVFATSSPPTDPLASLDLSADTNAEALKAAEAGQLGRPALVFFHADWCPVCRQIGPELEAIQHMYGGQLVVIRMNVDRDAAQPFLKKYRVRGTPTFVLIDSDGTVLANVAGWPGREAIQRAFAHVLASR